MRKRWLVLTLIIILVFAGVIYGLGRRGRGGTEVSTAPVSRGSVISFYSTSGTVDSSVNKEYYVQNAAKVVSVNAAVGDQVKKGEVLAQLDVQDMSTQLDIAQRQYDNAVIQLNALKALRDNMSKLPSNQGTQPAQTSGLSSGQGTSQSGLSLDDQIKMQENTTEIARLNVVNIQNTINSQQKYIKADFNGTVSQVNIKQGSMASPQAPAVVVEDTSNLVVNLNVNQYDISSIKAGQDATIVFNDKSFKGKVTNVNSVATKSITSTGTDTTVGVTVSILNNDGTLKSGYDVDVDIKTGQKDNVLKIPVEAIITDKNNNESVYVLENGVAKLKQIQTGVQSDTEAEVTSGLSLGDKVILNPPASISNGTKVKEKGV